MRLGHRFEKVETTYAAANVMLGNLVARGEATPPNEPTMPQPSADLLPDDTSLTDLVVCKAQVRTFLGGDGGESEPLRRLD